MVHDRGHLASVLLGPGLLGLGLLVPSLLVCVVGLKMQVSQGVKIYYCSC